MDDKSIAIIVAVVLIGVGSFTLPIVPVSFQEPYNEQIPYTIFEDKTSTIGTLSDYTLEGGIYKFWHKQLEAGETIEFSMRSSETVHVAVISSNEYDDFQDTGSLDNDLKSVIETSSVNFDYQIPSTDMYFFVIHNYHDGLLGIGKTDVDIYSCSITDNWTEEVTEYRNETKYRIVQKTVTLVEAITGSYTLSSTG